MQTHELLLALASDIDTTRDWLAELRAEVAATETRLSDLQAERRAVENAVSRYDPAARPKAPDPDPEWVSLTRVDAIERALREAGPLHLTEIAALLADRGRPRDDTAAISASLTSLQKSRQSVVLVGKGRWDYAGEKLAEPEGTTSANPPSGPTKPVAVAA